MKAQFPLCALLALACSAGLGAQVQYTLDVDPAQSPATWDGDTNLGALNGNKNFDFTGEVAAALGAAGAPFDSFAFNGGDLGTDPTTIIARVPNPIPFLPPLAEAVIQDVRFAADSPSVSVDAAGDFSADTVFTVLSGVADIAVVGFPATTLPLAGLFSDPFPLAGNISESGGSVILQSSVFVRLDIVVPGVVTGFIEFDGTVYADAPIKSASLALSANNVVAGQTASFDLSGGFSESVAYLVYSLSGSGSTFIPQINATLGVLNPVLLAGPTVADSAGNVSWSVAVPPGTTGASVLFQAAQQTAVSNVVSVTVG